MNGIINRYCQATVRATASVPLSVDEQTHTHTHTTDQPLIQFVFLIFRSNNRRRCKILIFHLFVGKRSSSRLIWRWWLNQVRVIFWLPYRCFCQTALYHSFLPSSSLALSLSRYLIRKTVKRHSQIKWIFCVVIKVEYFNQQKEKEEEEGETVSGATEDAKFFYLFSGKRKVAVFFLCAFSLGMCVVVLGSSGRVGDEWKWEIHCGSGQWTCQVICLYEKSGHYTTQLSSSRFSHSELNYKNHFSGAELLVPKAKPECRPDSLFA